MSSVIIRRLASVICHVYIYICTTSQMSPADIGKILHVNICNCGFHFHSWASLLGITPGHHSWALFLGATPGHHSWASLLGIILLGITPGHHSWASLLGITRASLLGILKTKIATVTTMTTLTTYDKCICIMPHASLHITPRTFQGTSAAKSKKI